MIALVVLLLALGVIVCLIVPRGSADGRSPLLHGQQVRFTRVGPLPFLPLVPQTGLGWQGRSWVFALVQLPSGICRAYVLQSPSYQGRPSNLLATHRLVDTFGRPYVCWSPEPTSPDQMAGALAIWVVATSRYLTTGDFPTAQAAGQELSRSSGPAVRGAASDSRQTRR